MKYSQGFILIWVLLFLWLLSQIYISVARHFSRLERLQTYATESEETLLHGYGALMAIQQNPNFSACLVDEKTAEFFNTQNDDWWHSQNSCHYNASIFYMVEKIPNHYCLPNGIKIELYRLTLKSYHQNAALERVLQAVLAYPNPESSASLACSPISKTGILGIREIL